MANIDLSSLHLILFSKNWRACRHFYGEVLGLKVCCERAGFVEFEINQGARIGLIRTKRRPSDRLVVSLCVTNIHQTRETLLRDIPEISEITAHEWDAWVMECRDPDNRRVEFWSPKQGSP